MHESNISLKAILRTGNTGYTCSHVEISTWMPSGLLRAPRGPNRFRASFTDLLLKARRATVWERFPPARGETLGWRSISPSMHRYRAALQVLLILSPSPLPSTSRSSLPSLCHTLFSLRRGEHALGHYVCAPPVAQERREFGRGGQKKWVTNNTLAL